MTNKIDSIYSGMAEQPCPPMTLRIGVAGQRRLDVKQLPILRQQLKDIYTDIHLLMLKIASHEIAKTIYSPDKIVIRYISSLAEGADRLCIEDELIPFEHELAAIIPFTRKEYEKDFLPELSVVDSQHGTISEFNRCLNRIGFDETGDNSRVALIELDGDISNRAEAYINCASVLAENSDLLIAVYNGDLSKETGTAKTVEEAMKQGIPVIHVSTQSPGKVTIHPSCLSGQVTSDVEYTKDNLERELISQLLFQDMFDKEEYLIERFKRYRSDESLSYNISTIPDFDSSGPIDLVKDFPNLGSKAFGFFKNLMTKGTKVNQIVKDMKIASRVELENQKNTDINAGASTHRIYGSFLRADRLATYYANIHRSTFLFIYILGAMALITASSAQAFGKYHGIIFSLVVFELLLLGCIFFLYRMDHRRDYHNCWLEYRCLAEILRPLIYLNLLGKGLLLFTRNDKSTTLDRGFMEAHTNSRRWVYIYLTGIIRWAGFSYCPSGSMYKAEVNDFINEVWIGKQIDYHINNAARMQVIGQRLKLFSFSLFFATLATVLIKIVILSIEYLFHLHFAPALTSIISLFTAVFPILATAAFSIRNHAEFEISAQRSFSILAIFLTQYRLHNKDELNLTNEMMCQKLQQLAYESINENAGWVEIYEAKESEPA